MTARRKWDERLKRQTAMMDIRGERESKTEQVSVDNI